jgi:hypothetical protein
MKKGKDECSVRGDADRITQKYWTDDVDKDIERRGRLTRAHQESA